MTADTLAREEEHVSQVQGGRMDTCGRLPRATSRTPHRRRGQSHSPLQTSEETEARQWRHAPEPGTAGK